ncbi:alpha/beta hydrolase [Zeaxanthinibacter sp. PT1]|uniref:alpha/beta fold hydrolase n=1 Tax=Zeaxanthinibacter TaxID=561554 RepID=UPI0023497D03|nr:alpha/beta hydrolase [Zeaxanthinibacter sp. PT1]MDC6351308.1 alpha/beta hydrolase [Zeaxanthinibacter sp. PT1]
MDVLKRNNVKVLGEGKQVMMFAHGFGCDQTMWRHVIPAYINDYKIVLFDYVGCGESDLTQYHEERYSSLHGYALDILDICETLDLRDIILIGHSVSSMIGMLASIKRPEYFRSLILVCPSPCYINKPGYHGGFEEKDLEGLMEVMNNNYVGWASFLAPVVMKNNEQPGLTEELERSFCSMDKEITQNFASITFFSDNRDDLKKVRVPCLVLQCSEDDIAPEDVGQYVNDQLEHSVIYYMKATGHCPHMSHPTETIECISRYLETELAIS